MVDYKKKSSSAVPGANNGNATIDADAKKKSSVHALASVKEEQATSKGKTRKTKKARKQIKARQTRRAIKTRRTRRRNK